MLNRTIAACVLVIGSAILASAAHSQDAGLAGDWQQIESNAGACPKCRISIGESGGSFGVAANNGWSATVGTEAKGSGIVGTGAWVVGKRGIAAGRPFDVAFRLVEPHLHMFMRVRSDDGSLRVIKAVFQRVWAGA